MMYYDSEKTEIEEMSAKFESYEKKVSTPNPALKRVSLDCEAVSILKVSDNFEEEKKPSILKKKGSTKDKERSHHSTELQSILKKPAVRRIKTQNSSLDFYPILKCKSLDDSTQLHMIELKPILKKRNSAEELKGEVVGEQRPIMKKKSLLGDDVEEKPKSILKNRVRSQEESDIKTDIVRVTRPRSDSEPGIRSILKKSTFEDEPVKPLSILRPHFPDSSALKTSFDNLFVENKLPSILKNPLPLCHQEDDEKLLSKKDHLQNTGLNIFGDVEHPQSILKHRNFSQGDVTQTQPVLKKNSKDYSLSVVNQNIGLKSFMRTRRKSDSPESDMILASSVVIISSDKQCSNESSTSEAERTKCLQTEQRVIKSTLSHTDSAVQTTESGLG